MDIFSKLYVLLSWFQISQHNPFVFKNCSPQSPGAGDNYEGGGDGEGDGGISLFLARWLVDDRAVIIILLHSDFKT